MPTAEWKAGGVRGEGRPGPGSRRASKTVMARIGERTKNIPCIVVTLDVSRLSGWLNADAPCGVERRAY
eukprot:scaffold6017_cov48-Phaeocystis_antarctica.AAC.1